MANRNRTILPGQQKSKGLFICFAKKAGDCFSTSHASFRGEEGYTAGIYKYIYIFLLSKKKTQTTKPTKPSCEWELRHHRYCGLMSVN